jgi:Ser/Thr protein kinase RdoA (MazF antagonist)
MLIPTPKFIGKRIWTQLHTLGDFLPELKHIACLYRLDKQWKYKPVRTGSNSKAVTITSKQGKWILKQYPARMQLPAVQFTHSVVTHLNETGFPSPRLKFAMDGHDYVYLDGHYYALFEFVPGYRYIDYYSIPRSRRHHYIEQAGATLANYHLVMRGFCPSGKRSEGYRSLATKKRWDEYSWHCDEWNRLIPLFLQQRNSSKLISESAACEIGKMLVDLAEQEKSKLLLSVNITHNDYGPYNLIFGPDATIKSVLDFDKVRIEERIEDVASSLIYFVGRINGGLDLDGGLALLNAYQSVYPLNEGELRQLPYILQRNRLRLLVWMLKRYMAASSGYARKLFLNTIAWLDWFESPEAHTDLQKLVETTLAKHD